jgi:hypothetical protein
MKEEFINVYNKALEIAEERYIEVYKWPNFSANIHNIDEFGIKFQFEEFNRGYVVNYGYVTVSWEELS